MTPYEIGFKVKLRLEKMRGFGSIVYYHVVDAERTKLEPMSLKRMFLGNDDDTKVYRVYDMGLEKVKVSRSVKLDELGMN